MDDSVFHGVFQVVIRTRSVARDDLEIGGLDQATPYKVLRNAARLARQFCEAGLERR